MVRKIISILAVGAFVGALAGEAMADYPGESPHGGQGLRSSSDREFVPEGNWAGTDWQASGPVETGSLPGTVHEESWMKDYGND